MFGRSAALIEILRRHLPEPAVNALLDILAGSLDAVEMRAPLAIPGGQETGTEQEARPWRDLFLGPNAQAMVKGKAMGIGKWCVTTEAWRMVSNPRTGQNEFLVKCRDCTDEQGLIPQGGPFDVYLQMTGVRLPELNVGDRLFYLFDEDGQRIGFPCEDAQSSQPSQSDPSSSSSSSSDWSTSEPPSSSTSEPSWSWSWCSWPSDSSLSWSSSVSYSWGDPSYSWSDWPSSWPSWSPSWPSWDPSWPSSDSGGSSGDSGDSWPSLASSCEDFQCAWKSQSSWNDIGGYWDFTWVLYAPCPTGCFCPSPGFGPPSSVGESGATLFFACASSSSSLSSSEPSSSEESSSSESSSSEDSSSSES